ncbi:MAG TPA: serine/threonine-protein kinase [Kofleriaceae bacterium]|jgi:serine/threonine-protein kinase
MEGTIIGQYRIVRKIGAGGMGAVYLAEHTLVGRRAAIKVLLPELSVRRGIVTRFFNEARAMTAIPDPGIVQMFDVGFHTDGSAYIVMELLEGETLERRRKRLGRLPLIDALRITRQVAGSLATAHERGVIHRDLKPDNIFIVRDGEAVGGERPKVLDFGIAKLSGDDERHRTMTGAMMGTPVYMSPEQCRGAGHVDHRSDIYSLGCVLFYLATGQPPFDRHGVGELISAHMNDAPPQPSELLEALPDAFDELVLRCLAKQPDARFQTMTELQAACDAMLVRLTDGSIAMPASTLNIPLSPGFQSGTLEPETPTTLSSAAGATNPLGRPRRIGIWIGFGATGVVAIVISILIGMSGSHAPIAVEPAAAPIAPAPPPPLPMPVTAIDAGAAIAPSVSVDAPVAKPKPRPRTAPAPKPTDDLYDDR